MTITVADPGALERDVEKTGNSIEETSTELGTDDRREAYTTLKAVLHALRAAHDRRGGEARVARGRPAARLITVPNR